LKAPSEHSKECKKVSCTKVVKIDHLCRRLPYLAGRHSSLFACAQDLPHDRLRQRQALVGG
jgi:hypothetical protein